MSFTITSLELCGFRSYKHAHVELDPQLTIFYGPNGAGKTNIVEALQLLSIGESFRKPLRQDLIHWEFTQMRIIAKATNKNLKRDIELHADTTSKTFFVNEKRVRSTQEMSCASPCVIFTPDDLRIIKESSSRRRQEIDGLGSQLSVTYSRLVSEYKKIVAQRNKLLKEEQFGTAVFEAWNERLIEVGLALAEKRSSLFEYLVPPMKNYYQRLLDPDYRGQKLDICYTSNWGKERNEQSFRNALEEHAHEERSRRQSLVGPHRDDIVFMIEGKNARSFASQGQQRSIVLAWKLAQLSVIEELLGARPLLLLDDVMSEFDQTRRRYLAKLVGNLAQTVITTAHIDYFEKELLEKAKKVLIPDDLAMTSKSEQDKSE